VSRRYLWISVAAIVVIGVGVFLFNVRISGPDRAIAQATQQALNSANPSLAVVATYPDGGAGSVTYAPVQATLAGAPVIQLANPSSSIPTNGIALANDAGTSDILTGAKSFPVVNLDGGASGTQGLIGLPQVTAKTTAICNLINPAAAGTAAATNYGCNGLVEQPAGGDAGYVLVTANLANLGFDGGQCACVVLN
jgi:hypothetical protein